MTAPVSIKNKSNKNFRDGLFQTQILIQSDHHSGRCRHRRRPRHGGLGAEALQNINNPQQTFAQAAMAKDANKKCAALKPIAIQKHKRLIGALTMAPAPKSLIVSSTKDVVVVCELPFSQEWWNICMVDR